jgi:hypothetical protein
MIAIKIKLAGNKTSPKTCPMADLFKNNLAPISIKEMNK